MQQNLENLPTDLPPCAAPHPRGMESFWTRHYACPIANHGSTGTLPSSADVVIIGTGLTGTSATAKLVDDLLAGAGQKIAGGGGGVVRVVVLDARSFCFGATARNGGHLTGSYPLTHFNRNTADFGLENARKEFALEVAGVDFILDICRDEGWEEDVDLVRGGNVRFYHDINIAREEWAAIEAARKAGEDTSFCKWYSPEAARKLYKTECKAAIRIPGNNIYPRKFVTKLFMRTMDRVKAAGPASPVSLELYTNAPVISVIQSESDTSRWSVNTSVGSIDARFVIHATNAYASHILPSLSSGPDAIVPTRGQCISYQPSAGSNPHWTASKGSSYEGNYFFQRPDGGPIILGGSRELIALPQEMGTTDDSQINRDISAKLRAYLPDNFPDWFAGEKRAGEVEMEWTGVMAYRRSGVPLVGKVYVEGRHLKGQFISAGYTGHGMPRAGVCGQAVALMVLDELRGMESSPPAWLPGHYISKPEGSDQPATMKTKSASSWWCTVM